MQFLRNGVEGWFLGEGHLGVRLDLVNRFLGTRQRRVHPLFLAAWSAEGSQTVDLILDAGDEDGFRHFHQLSLRRFFVCLQALRL